MGRLYYLDAMRSILMMLGIVLHAAIIFGSDSWLLEESERSSIYNSIVDFIHLFRMPAFFIVSGFFCHMTISRYGSKLFLKVRTPRIFIPLLVAAISLNSIQYLFLIDYKQFNTAFLSFEYFINGLWLSHLWFLVSLLYYFSISAICYHFFRKYFTVLSKFFSWIYLKSTTTSLLVLSLISLIVTKASYLTYLIIPENTFDWVIGDSISYSTYFIFGFLAGHNRLILERFTQLSVSVLVFSISIIIIGYIYLDSLPKSLLNTVSLGLNSLSSWVLCYLCFIAFKQLTNKASRFFGYFSDASYSIYLFHHLLVIVYATLLYQLSIPFWFMFLLLMITTFISTLLIHHYMIRNFSILKYLFNGKR